MKNFKTTDSDDIILDTGHNMLSFFCSSLGAQRPNIPTGLT
jgi:hypothetical protein